MEDEWQDRSRVGRALLKASTVKALGSVVVGGMFLWFARSGPFYYFDPDDVLNMYTAWTEPLRKLLLTAFSPVRSLGFLIYKVLHALIGLHPLPFHLFCYALLAINIYLLYCLARRLTGSWGVAMFAALLGSFHSRMESLYTSIANVFDIGSQTFFLCTFLYYLRLREKQRDARLIEIGFLTFIYLCALGFKEMAATLPVVLACYEFIYHGPFRFRRAELRRWRAICILSLITVAYMLPSLIGVTPLTQSYRPEYSLHRLLENWQMYLGFLFYVLHSFSLAAMLALYALLLAVALFLKSKPLILCWCFVLITPLPVLFIEPRGLNVWYIPFVGWVVYAATLMFCLLDKFFPASSRLHGPAAAALFVLLTAFLAAAHTRERNYTFNPQGRLDEVIRRFRAQFVEIRPTLQPGSHTLFLADPFSADEWTPVTLLRLNYGDPNLEIQRWKMAADRVVIDNSTYDFVFDYHEDQLVLLNSRPLGPEEVRTLLASHPSH